MHFLVQHDWLEKWRAHIISAAPGIPPLSDAVTNLRCDHAAALVPQHTQTFLAGGGGTLLRGQEVDADERRKYDVEIIEAVQWNRLTERYDIGV